MMAAMRRGKLRVARECNFLLPKQHTTATNTSGPIVSETWKDTLTGWTVGVGGEWALWQNWTGRIEYRYTDYKSFTGVSSVVAPGGSFGTDDLKFHTVRAGLSYRFGDWGKGPMVARY